MYPSESALLTNILVGSSILFVIAYLGNALTFTNRLVNALITAVIFAVFYGALIYTADRTVIPPELKEASRQAWLQMVVMAASVVFALDLVANFLSFKNRLVSALVTAVLFAVLFGFAIYSTGGLMHGPVETGPLAP